MISDQARSKLDKILKAVNDADDLPGCYAGAATADEILYFQAAGDKVFGRPEYGSAGEHTQLQLLSATKFLTIIACLQLVDQKVLSLDDASTIEKHLPESWTVPVLAGYDASDKPITHARRNPLTLRHLLSHTSGIGYPYNSPGIQRWIDENDIPNWFVCESGIKPLVLPLVYEPGTRWHFGLGIDWAGVLVSRASELVWTNTFSATSSARWLSQIAQCIQRMISDDIKREIQPICLMGPDGRFSPDKEEFKPRSWSPEALKSGLQSGGAGLFGTAKSYLRFLQGVLASRNGGGIISKASFDELFKSPLQQGEQGSQQRADMAVFAEDVALYDPAHLSNGTGSGLDFSTGLMINTVDSIHGRKAGAACGDGAARTQYWIDPGSGLVGVCFTNMLAFPPPDAWIQLCNRFERAAYDSIVG